MNAQRSTMNGDRIYRALLHLYPADFRAEYREEMLEAFREMRRRRRTGTFAFWAFVVSDTLVAAGRERAVAPRWVAICLFALLATLGAARAMSWAYVYFYHPYLEGVVIRAWWYGLALGVVLGGTVALGQRLLMPARTHRARAWAIASGVVWPLAIMICSAVAGRVFVSLNHPVGANPDVEGVAAFVAALDAAAWRDFATYFTAMAASALLVGSLGLWPAGRRRVHQTSA